MGKLEDFGKVIKVVTELMDVTDQDILGKSREAEVVDARWMVICLMREKGYSARQISMLVLHPERTVNHALNAFPEPMIQSLVSPMVGRLMKGIPEEQVKDIAMKFADAFVKQAREKGSVNLFGLEMGENAFADLRAILASKFEDDEGLD